jgi:hypothetical protein
VTVANFGGVGVPSASGFQVTFGGTLAGQNVPNLLQLTNVSGFTGSINEIEKGGAVDNRGAVSSTGNTPPVVTAPASYTIPYRTPFALSGSATDADGDPLTYMWEQNDIDTGAGTALTAPQKTSGPLFRQFGTALDASIYDPGLYDSPGENHPTGDPTRVFPDMAQVLAGNTNANTGDCPNGPPPPMPPVPPGLIDCYSEFLPTPGYAGPMHFRLTARDGRAGGGGVASAETIVSLAPGTGPFRVTAPSAPRAPRTRGSGPTQTVTWDVAGTAGGAINAANVRISLSTDGGQTFPVTLAESTANDGSAQVTPPAVTSNQARIKIEALGNVFFDVSDANFSTFTIDRLSRNRKKGTAKLTVSVPGPGVLALGGHGVKPVRGKPVAAAGRVHLLVKAKGSKKRKLKKSGKVKVRLSIAYTPTGGTPASQSLKVKLKRKR